MLRQSKPPSRRWPLPQIERLRTNSTGQLNCKARSVVVWDLFQIRNGNRSGAILRYDLYRQLRRSGGTGPQSLMTPYHLIQAAFKRISIELSTQARGGSHIVDRAAARLLLKNPIVFLLEGQGETIVVCALATKESKSPMPLSQRNHASMAIRWRKRTHESRNSNSLRVTRQDFRAVLRVRREDARASSSREGSF